MHGIQMTYSYHYNISKTCFPIMTHKCISLPYISCIKLTSSTDTNLRKWSVHDQFRWLFHLNFQLFFGSNFKSSVFCIILYWHFSNCPNINLNNIVIVYSMLLYAKWLLNSYQYNICWLHTEKALLRLFK